VLQGNIRGEWLRRKGATGDKPSKIKLSSPEKESNSPNGIFATRGKGGKKSFLRPGAVCLSAFGGKTGAESSKQLEGFKEGKGKKGGGNKYATSIGQTKRGRNEEKLS